MPISGKSDSEEAIIIGYMWKRSTANIKDRGIDRRNGTSSPRPSSDASPARRNTGPASRSAGARRSDLVGPALWTPSLPEHERVSPPRSVGKTRTRRDQWANGSLLASVDPISNRSALRRGPSTVVEPAIHVHVVGTSRFSPPRQSIDAVLTMPSLSHTLSRDSDTREGVG